MARATNPVGRNAVAVGKATKGLTLLGRLVTYTHPDDGVPGPKAVRTWGKHGLDVSLLPSQRSGVHIFQSACRSVESRRHNGHQVEVKVDEVLHTSGECVYQITRMVRDRAERIIEHPKAMTIAFDKGIDSITVRELEDYDELRGLEEQIRKHYTKNAKNIPGQQLRKSVRQALVNVGAQNLRRKAGGLYFVPDTYLEGRDHKPTEPTLEGLAGMLEDLYGDRVDFYTIPLVNDQSAQDMVRKHFTINVCEHSQEIMERALQRLRQGAGERGVRSDLLANLWNERRKIVASVDQFDSLVKLERKEIDKNVRDLDEALTKLQDLADKD